MKSHSSADNYFKPTMMRPQKQEERNFKFNFLAHIKGEAKASIKTSFIQLTLLNNQGKDNNMSLGLKFSFKQYQMGMYSLASRDKSEDIQ